MTRIAHGLAQLHGLYVHVLLRTGVEARLSALPLAGPPEVRSLWLLVLGAAGILLLYSALAEGSSPAVRSFRVFTLLGGACLPLAGLRLAGTPRGSVFGGVVLVLLFLAGLVHRALSGQRRDSLASRAIERCRLGVEVLGLLLFAAAGVELAAGREVPVRLAFWALFLLRLSVSDLLDPARLASETGLTASAAADVKKATGRARRGRRPLAGRLVALVRGALKTAVLCVWIALPLAAALAPGEVAAGEWPGPSAAILRFYAPAALGLTSVLLLGEAWKGLPGRPLEAGRALAAGVATGAYLVFAYHDPSFAAYRQALPWLVLLETCFGFLVGAAGLDRGR